jgi:hypothetical protein
VTPPTPRQQQRRAAFESLIGFAAPVLDLVLVAGDRLARIVGPGDDYIPIRAPSEALELERARSARAERAPSRETAD